MSGGTTIVMVSYRTGPVLFHAIRAALAQAGVVPDVVVLSVGGDDVSDLAGLYRRVWAMGVSGVEVPVSIYRDGKTFDARIKSSDRNRFLKTPRLH